MNIIVAVLFDNYEEHDTSEMNSELKELEDKAKELKIPKGIIEVIIYKDLLLGKSPLNL
jgi:transcriptional/translational regulatory protein YebC/TACO1